MKMDNIIVAKLSCDDNILKASKKFGADEVKEVASAALIFTPFTVVSVELIRARVAEKYFSACKKLGYHTGFFREYTILALCRLQSGHDWGFDGIYVPFSGEIYLIPQGCLDVETVSAENCDMVLTETEKVKKLRRFSINLESVNKQQATWKKIQIKFTGRNIPEFEGKRISSLSAVQDICIEDPQGKSNLGEYQPMHFLYNMD